MYLKNSSEKLLSNGSARDSNTCSFILFHSEDHNQYHIEKVFSFQTFYVNNSNTKTDYKLQSVLL